MTLLDELDTNPVNAENFKFTIGRSPEFKPLNVSDKRFAHLAIKNPRPQPAVSVPFPAPYNTSFRYKD